MVAAFGAAKPRLAEGEESGFRQNAAAVPCDGSPILSVVRGPMLAIVCEPCGRRGRYSVARPIEEHSNAKLTDLFCDAGLARALSLKLTMPRLWAQPTKLP